MTPALLEVGFFSELRHGRADGPSLKGAVRSNAAEHEAELVGYLSGGSTLAVNGTTTDALSGEPLSEALAILTDGVWVWPSDLPHYIERYHVELPEAFLTHAAAHSWTAPQLSPDELAAVEAAYVGS